MTSWRRRSWLPTASSADRFLACGRREAPLTATRRYLRCALAAAASMRSASPSAPRPRATASGPWPPTTRQPVGSPQGAHGVVTRSPKRDHAENVGVEGAELRDVRLLLLRVQGVGVSRLAQQGVPRPPWRAWNTGRGRPCSAYTSGVNVEDVVIHVDG